MTSLTCFLGWEGVGLFLDLYSFVVSFFFLSHFLSNFPTSVFYYVGLKLSLRFSLSLSFSLYISLMSIFTRFLFSLIIHFPPFFFLYFFSSFIFYLLISILPSPLFLYPSPVSFLIPSVPFLTLTI